MPYEQHRTWIDLQTYKIVETMKKDSKMTYDSVLGNVNLARKCMAKFLSLTNAAEFIRLHGEEGFSFNDEKLDKIYKRNNKILANQLDKRAEAFRLKYEATGVHIDTDEYDYS